MSNQGQVLAQAVRLHKRFKLNRPADQHCKQIRVLMPVDRRACIKKEQKQQVRRFPNQELPDRQ